MAPVKTSVYLLVIIVIIVFNITSSASSSIESLHGAIRNHCQNVWIDNHEYILQDQQFSSQGLIISGNEDKLITKDKGIEIHTNPSTLNDFSLSDNES